MVCFQFNAEYRILCMYMFCKFILNVLYKKKNIEQEVVGSKVA